MKVVLVSSYSMADMRELVDEGLSPRHQLWGADGLEAAGHEVVYVPQSRWGLLKWLSRMSRNQFGDVEKVLRVWWLSRTASAVVLLEPSCGRGLGLLRAARLLRVPLVLLVHPGFQRTRLARQAVKGADEVLTLSKKIAEALVADGLVPRAEATWWGVDPADPRYTSTGHEGIFASGKTHRDFPLLDGALRRNGERALVAVADPDELRGFGHFDCVHAAHHPDILRHMARAAVVVIPLSRVDGTFGMTEMSDAIALGKVVVLTDNPYLDVPSGPTILKVPQGDVQALADALATGLAFAGTADAQAATADWAARCSYASFCTALVAALDRATTKSHQR